MIFYSLVSPFSLSSRCFCCCCFPTSVPHSFYAALLSAFQFIMQWWWWWIYDCYSTQLPKFLALCKDAMWSVRKNCAEVFTVVATVSQLVTRKKILAPAFVALLQDSSKWVRVAAYQTLGPFITTFAADDSSTCTQESSEIEQAFLERYVVLLFFFSIFFQDDVCGGWYCNIPTLPFN